MSAISSRSRLPSPRSVVIEYGATLRNLLTANLANHHVAPIPPDNRRRAAVAIVIVDSEGEGPTATFTFTGIAKPGAVPDAPPEEIEPASSADGPPAVN